MGNLTDARLSDNGREDPQDNPFAFLWRLGYRRIVPIVPPTAHISPNSNLSKNLDARGKSVGVKGRDGLWSGLGNWVSYEATEADMKRWQAMEAGAGVKAGPIDPSKADGDWLAFIDSDTYDAPLAKQVDVLVHEHFGPLPCRVGLYPKAMYPIRVTGPLPYRKVQFGEVDANTGARKHAVEILVGMRQSVFFGIHQRSGEPYRWPRPLVPLNALTIVAPEKIEAFMEDLRSKLPNATTSALLAKASADRANIDQDELKGDMDLLEQAMDALPNDRANFPTYDHMTAIGYACRGGFQADPDRGLDVFDRWCAKWEGGDYDPGLVKKWWDSYKPPYSAGAPQIFKRAAELAPETFNIGRVWFEEIVATAEDARAQSLSSLFEGPQPQARASRKFGFRSFEESAEMALAARAKPLVEGLMDCGAFSVVYGAPGAGKSFVMLRLAHCVAAGRPFGGRKVTQGAVAYVAAEGGGGIHARVKALRDECGSYGDEGFPVPFYLLPETINLRDPRADLGPFLEALRDLEGKAGRLVLVVIDTLARSMGGGDENSPVDMGAMVEHFDRVRSFTGAHVTVVHHTGKDAARGMRGHSSLLGAIDTEIEVGDGIVRTGKQRDLESDQSFAFRLRSVALGIDADGRPMRSAIAEIEPIVEGRATSTPGKLTALELKILEVMKAADPVKPLSVAEIAGALLARGQGSPESSVRRTLYALKDKCLVENLGRGKWTVRADKLSEIEARNETLH